MRNSLLSVFFLTVTTFLFGQDTVYCCSPMDTYIASQCDLIFKDSVCYKSKKEFTGVLVVNCNGDSKSRRNNGIYEYEKGKLISSRKLRKDQILQSGIPFKIKSSSQRKFSGGMRKQFGGDHNETYEFLMHAETPIKIDSIVHLNKVFIPSDSLGLLTGDIRFRVFNAFNGGNGVHTSVALLETVENNYPITDYYTGDYKNEALKIYYTVNGRQLFAIKKEYDSVEHNAAP